MNTHSLLTHCKMMEAWWITAVVALIICAFFNFLLTHLIFSNKPNLPPGPFALPLLGNPIWLFKSLSDLEPVLRSYHSRYGPILTLRFLGNAPSIFISGHSAAHRALVTNGAVFADRFPVWETAKLITSNQHNISTAFYGHTWRVLRRNLTAQLLHPSRLKANSPSRKWALDELCRSLLKHASTPVTLLDHLRRAMFNLAAAMCFGERFDEEFVDEIQESQRGVLLNIGKFNDLNFWPAKLGKFLFRKRWEEIYQLRKRQNDLLLPLINARKTVTNKNEINAVPYVDTLFDLEIADNNDEKKRRKLVEDELITLCSEFLDAVTDTTVASMQWIMANLVKHPKIQEKLYEEMKEVMGERDEIEEEDIERMLYLKAVVMEGLRLHPPGHLLLPHKVMEDTEVEGYKIPKGTSVNFMVADMGWDPKVWANPSAFEPGRFIRAGTGDVEVELDVDVTGSKEIKMMPFGAGRRICPGFALGLLHLEYFVGNLVWKFRWMAVGDVDLSEKQESAVTMKHSLLCCLSPRRRATVSS